MLPNTTEDKGKGLEQYNQIAGELSLENLDLNDLPTSVFACDVPAEVFDNDIIKSGFEDLFLPFKATNFIYLRNFRRVRIYFESPLEAAQARIALHEYTFKDQILRIFFAQVQPATDETSVSLLPPQPERFFLISPPASPPVGWEPVLEGRPVINYSLLSAVASLEPGQSHEIHPGTITTPSVVLHTCEDDEQDTSKPARVKIQQTRRPDLPN